MGLIHNDQKIILKIVQKALWRLSRLLIGQMTGIILNATTKACLTQHFHIKIGTLRDTLRFDQFVLSLEKAHALLQLFLNLDTGFVDLVLWYDIMGGRKNSDMIHLTPYFHRKSIQFRDTIDLIPKKFHTIGIIRGIRRNDLQHITTHPKSTTGKIHVVAHILHIYQLSDHLIPILLIPRPQGNHHILVVIRATNTIDAGYRRYDNDIAPLCQGCRSRQT